VALSSPPYGSCVWLRAGDGALRRRTLSEVDLSHSLDVDALSLSLIVEMKLSRALWFRRTLADLSGLKSLWPSRCHLFPSRQPDCRRERSHEFRSDLG
jgi:hypothetical protein